MPVRAYSEDARGRLLGCGVPGAVEPISFQTSALLCSLQKKLDSCCIMCNESQQADHARKHADTFLRWPYSSINSLQPRPWYQMERKLVQVQVLSCQLVQHLLRPCQVPRAADCAPCLAIFKTLQHGRQGLAEETTRTAWPLARPR